MNKKRFGNLKKEILEHIPFTLLASVFAVILVLLIRFSLNKEISESVFEVLHPMHVFVSAIVTSAIYYRYKKSVIPAIIIGVTGAIIVGSLSDILLPYLGGLILGLEPEFHLPIIKETFLILSTAIIGSFLGIVSKITKLPHVIHVFLSVFASLFYILSFSNVVEIIYLIYSLIIVFVAVFIPCCISDIIYPLFFVKSGKHVH